MYVYIYIYIYRVNHNPPLASRSQRRPPPQPTLGQPGNGMSYI